MNIKQKVFVILFNLLLSMGFYLDNTNALYTDVSSDSANIIPVCKKKDNPQLYKNDLYLDDIKNVEYYTPFYVESLRSFSKFSKGNYLQAQNILGTIIHFIHGVLWFLLLYNIKKDYWIALLVMLLTKGVIWPPGGELIGITELWTIMPRTVYTALLPLPFLLYRNLKKNNLIIASFVLGFILNFHPLSGIGGIIGYFSLYVTYLIFNKNEVKVIWQKVVVAIVFTLIGMMPYLYTYLTKVSLELVSNPALFELAFNKRIPRVFSNPIEFVKQWNRPVFYFYFAGFLLFYFFDFSKNQKIYKTLLLVFLVIFLSANLSVYVENVINKTFNMSLRMSFQLIRYQKFILVLFQISLFLLLSNVLEKWKTSNLIRMWLFVLFYFFLMFANFPPLKQLPFIGDDICNTTLPYSLKINDKKIPQETKDFNEMLSYIKDNTPKQAVFYGSFYIRYASERSVILDGKGASMIIEGNPNKFSQWYLDVTSLKSLQEKDKIDFLKSKNVSYILSRKDDWNFLVPVKVIGRVKLYKI